MLPTLKLNILIVAMSSSTSETTPVKASSKSYAAACSPRPIVPAVARLSLENSPPPKLTTEPFPPLSSGNKKTSPLGKTPISEKLGNNSFSI